MQTQRRTDCQSIPQLLGQRPDKNSERCPLAREHRKVHVELREILFGRRPNVYRVIFLIDRDTVRVLRIRRARRRPLTADFRR